MGDDPEDRQSLRAIWGWITLIGLISFLFACAAFPPLLRALTGRETGSAPILWLAIPLAMFGLLSLARLTSAILELRDRRSRE